MIELEHDSLNNIVIQRVLHKEVAFVFSAPHFVSNDHGLSGVKDGVQIILGYFVDHKFFVVKFVVQLVLDLLDILRVDNDLRSQLHVPPADEIAADGQRGKPLGHLDYDGDEVHAYLNGVLGVHDEVAPELVQNVRLYDLLLLAQVVVVDLLVLPLFARRQLDQDAEEIERLAVREALQENLHEVQQLFEVGYPVVVLHCPVALCVLV